MTELDVPTSHADWYGRTYNEGELAEICAAQETRIKELEARSPQTLGQGAGKLRLAHQARRAKEHQLDGIRRALCDAGFMEDDDPYGHADLADVIRQAGR